MPNRNVVTRFAPSPTGMLHIGGARTALFNWLYARANDGAFRLRIEDTDRARSSPEATEAILAGLQWLGLDWDGDVVSQHDRRQAHVAAARKLVDSGLAYRCYAAPEEIERARELARESNQPVLFQSPWRDAAPPGDPARPFTIRLKSPATGETVISDAVCGTVAWKNETLDDMIIVRSDGSPTYNFAVVIDDREMGISHVIRGDDHLANSARQQLVYAAFGWPAPVFAHIPLIHSESGNKLSKRAGDPGLEHYQARGILPEAMRNYLARLGWSHGDDEFFSTAQAIDWFKLEALRRSPARLNDKKLVNLSRQHLAIADATYLAAEILRIRAGTEAAQADSGMLARLVGAMPALRQGARTLVELADRTGFIFARRPLDISPAAAKFLDSAGLAIVQGLQTQLHSVEWGRHALESAAREFCERTEMPLGKLAPPLRASLAGSTVSPSVFDMMVILGRDETLARLHDTATGPSRSSGQAAS